MRRRGDENLFVEFYKNAVKSEVASDAAGHPVYIDKPFVRIMVPGDPNTVIDTVANKGYQDRFPDEWRAFQQNDEQVLQGWPLKEWPVINPSQVKNLEFLNVRTVEQLAGLTDAQCQKVGMGTDSLRAKAKAAVAAAQDGAAISAQAAENKHLRDEMQSMREMIANLQLAKDAEEDAPRRGRPRKETVE